MAMHSNSTVALAAGGGGGDRLSKLGDATLGHILSFLPADEAARAAVLSRRWRHVFTHVHTVSLDEPEPEYDYDDDAYSCYTPGYGRCRGCENKDRVTAFVNRVSAALLRRAGGVPMRALRVGFDLFWPGINAAMVDVWLSHAVQQAGDEFHLDFRLRRHDDLIVCDRRYSLCRDPPSVAAEKTPPLAAAGDDADDDKGDQKPTSNDYVTPRSIFTCAALRTLRLGSCYLDLPPSSSITLPSLDTLHLTAITGGKRAVQRLVCSCPRLAALTLEACAKLTALTVPAHERLRTLALRCCHDLVTVIVADASELRTFEYRGAVRASPSFLIMHRRPVMVSSCTLDFCGEESMELAGLVDMLRKFVGVERLHLTSARLGCGVAALSLSAIPAFAKLRHLEITGVGLGSTITS